MDIKIVVICSCSLGAGYLICERYSKKKLSTLEKEYHLKNKEQTRKIKDLEDKIDDMLSHPQ